MASLENSDDFDQKIHQRFLEKDATASSDLVSAYLNPIIRGLQSQFPEVRDEALIHGATLNAMLNYMKNPSSFKRERGKSLLNYLKMSARGDLINEIKREKKTKKNHEKNESILRHDATKRNKDLWDEVEDADNREKLEILLREEFPDLLDWKLYELIYRFNAKKTSIYVPLLEIQDKDEVEQQRIVNRHKDRIKKRVDRLCKKWRGGNYG